MDDSEALVYTVPLVLLNDYGLFYSVDARILNFWDEVNEVDYFHFVISEQPRPYIIAHVTNNFIGAITGQYLRDGMIENFNPEFPRMLNALEAGLKGQFAAIDVERIDLQFYRQANSELRLDSRNFVNEEF